MWLTSFKSIFDASRAPSTLKLQCTTTLLKSKVVVHCSFSVLGALDASKMDLNLVMSTFYKENRERLQWDCVGDRPVRSDPTCMGI